MAVVYAARGITVNCVCPGPIPTSLRATSKSILGPGAPEMSGRGPGDDDEQLRALVPAGERGTVEDVAAAVCYLASDEARYVNGHDLVVDGGVAGQVEGAGSAAGALDPGQCGAQQRDSPIGMLAACGRHRPPADLHDRALATLRQGELEAQVDNPVEHLHVLGIVAIGAATRTRS